MFNFSSIKKAVADVQDRLDAITAERRDLTAQINKITSAAANKKDLHKIVDAWLSRSGKEFAPAIADAMRQHHASGNLIERDIGFFSAMPGPAGDVNRHALDSCMIAIFGKEIGKSIHFAVDEMEWPDEGLPQAERASELKRLHDRIAVLDAERAELVEAAREAGVDV